MADVSQVDQADIKSLWENLEALSGKSLDTRYNSDGH